MAKIAIPKNRRITIVIILFLLFCLGITLYYLPQIQDIRKKAASIDESMVPSLIKSSEVEYAPGQVIVKLKDKTRKLEVKESEEIDGLAFDREAIALKDIKEESLPDALVEINQMHPIKKISKVFKDFESPEKELIKVKQKFSQELAGKQRIIDEENFLSLDLSGIYKITFEQDIPPEEIVALLEKSGSFEYVEPNYVYKTQLAPNDPFYYSSGSWGQSYPDLWGIKKINPEEAWMETTGSDQVVVADIDTGLDRSHPDIEGNIWVNEDEIPNNGIDDDNNGFIDDYYGWDFANNDNDPLDDNGHGTHTAGTIAAVGGNHLGVVGVSWKTKIMGVKFLDAFGSGYLDAAASALYYAANNGAKISSNSWGGPDSFTIKQAIVYQYALGLTIVAAAGNANDDVLLHSPASLDQVIAVSATDYNDQKASFSNWGEKIDVAAPGVDILSLKSSENNVCPSSKTVEGRYCRLSGTSMAAPHVSGLAALLLSKDPTLTREEIRQLIRVGADDIGDQGKDLYFGYGRINVSKTIDLIDNKPLVPYISYPKSNFTFQGETLKIYGSISGEDFKSYQIEIGQAGKPDSWITVFSSTRQITSGELASIDLSPFRDDYYIIRLTAYDTSGFSFQYQIYNFLLDNFEIDINSPFLIFNKLGDVEITGTALVKGGFGLERYSISWKEDALNSSWVEDDINLKNQGKYPVENGQLALWNTEKLEDGKRYLLRLKIFSTNGFSDEKDYSLIFQAERNLRNGWPQKLDESNLYYGNTIVLAEDLNNDGKKEIVAHNHGNKIYVFNDQGQTLPGWPQTITVDQGQAVVINPSIGNIDGGRDREIVVKTNKGKLFVFKYNGSQVTGFPKNPLSTTLFTIHTPVLFDLDRDGKDEIIVDQGAGYIHAYRSNGTELPGWPVMAEKDTGEGSESYISVGDVNGDSYFEVVIANQSKLYVFDYKGQLLPDWPKSLFSEGIPILADFNNDGKNEIISSLYDIPNFTFKMRILNYKADIIDSIEYQKFPNFYYPPNVSLSIGDINNDGVLEIVIGESEGKIYAFKVNGDSVNTFPINYDSQVEFYPGVVIADINNDQHSEIFLNGAHGFDSEFAAWRFLYGFSTKGRLLDSYPKMFQFEGLPTVTDLDNDGTLELLFISKGEVHVWNLGVNYSSQSLQWPQYLHDSQHTGNYRSTFATPTPTNQLKQLEGCYETCIEDKDCKTGLLCSKTSCHGDYCPLKSYCYNPSCPSDNTCSCKKILPTKNIE